MKKRHIMLVLILLVFIFFFLNSRPEKQLSVNETNVTESPIETELTDEEYKNLRTELLHVLEKENPEPALLLLQQKMDENPAVLRSCHSLVHELGHAAYDKYADFGEVIKYQKEFCNSGYLHGAIEIHFSKSKDVFFTMETTCDPYPFGKFLSFECFHGIGHGLMYYTSNDLPKSLEFCKKFNAGFGRENCLNGVFMENFNVDQKIHVSKFLQEDDPFYPCADQNKSHQKHCYVYAPIYYLSLHDNNYAQALSWCLNVEAPHSGDCSEGVGIQAMLHNMKNPKFVEQVCLTGNQYQRTNCIKGMTGIYLNHLGDTKETQRMCQKLEFGNRQTCLSTIKSRESLF